jgi:hypothetical protein
VPTFLVDLYLPRPVSVEEVADRARLAADLAGGAESGIRYVRSTHVAEEEMCFVTFEAPSREFVIEVARVAGWERAHVIEAVETGSSAATESRVGIRPESKA